MVALVCSARLYVCSHHTKRFLAAIKYEEEETYRYLMASDAEDARRSMILSLLVDHGLFYHPEQHAQLKHNLPAYTVGSLRAHVQVECLVNVIETLISSDEAQAQRLRFMHALHEVFAFSQSKKLMIQRQLG